MLNQNAMLNFDLRLTQVTNICYIGHLHLYQLRIDQEQNGGCTPHIDGAFSDEYLLSLSISNATRYTWDLDSNTKETILHPSEALFSRRHKLRVATTLLSDVFPNKKFILIYLNTTINHGGHASVDEAAAKILYTGFL